MIPSKLQLGDTIGVIAPSEPITQKNKQDMENSKALLEKAGFHVVFGENMCLNTLGYGATPQEKARDLNDMFWNKKIKAIFCAKGGYNSNSLFEYIDYELIKHNPKIIAGFSDPTSILNIIYEKTGLITFHCANFKTLTTWETDYDYQEVIKRLVNGNLELGTMEDEYSTIIEGETEGELLGGNLSLISRMVCGKYSLDFTDKILFIEDLGMESGPGMISNFLYYMKQNNIFHQINGLWIGNYEHESGMTLEKIVLDTIGDEYSFPIIKSNNFGHTEKKTVIPIGIKAKIDTTKEVKIELLEECVK